MLSVEAILYWRVFNMPTTNSLPKVYRYFYSIYNNYSFTEHFFILVSS